MNFLTFSFGDFLTAIHVIFVIVFWLSVSFLVFIYGYLAIRSISIFLYAKRTKGTVKGKSDNPTLIKACVKTAVDGATIGHRSHNYWIGIGNWRYYDTKNRKFVYGIFAKK